MLDAVLGYLAERSPLALARDAFDIFLVYYIIYRALLVLRGTRAMQVGIGLGMVFLLYVVARLLQLVTLLSIMGAVVSSIILIIVVVFQNDIRRFLHRVGSRAWFGGLTRAHETHVIDKVVDAATELARHRTGAIVAFEQDANLDEFVGVHKGHDVDAAVTRDLLVSLFVPEAMNKLHDGAVIIRSLRIAKAGVFFPMPEGRVVDDSFGSRHRAALGITEETDAVVVVVSEERGSISFCFNGNIASNLDGPKLRTMLEAIFSPKSLRKRRSDARRSQAALVGAERATGDVEDAAARSTPGSEPPSLRTRPASEPPPPLRPRASGDSAEAKHITGRHTTDRDATRPLRAPEGDASARLRGRSAEATQNEPPPPLRPRATAEGEAVRTTAQNARITSSTSSATLTPLSSAAVEPTAMPRSTLTTTQVSSSGDDSTTESECPEALPSSSDSSAPVGPDMLGDDEPPESEHTLTSAAMPRSPVTATPVSGRAGGDEDGPESKPQRDES